MAKPIEINLTCYKGQTYNQDFHIKENGQYVDLTVYTPKSQIRKKENDEKLVAEFVCGVTADGLLSLGLSHEVTGNIDPDFYKYDVKMVDENEAVDYWIRGTFSVIGRVTE